MKHISLLIPQGQASIVNIEGTHQVLSWVNQFLEQSGRPPKFNLHLVGLSRNTQQSSGLFTIHPHLLVNEVTKTDLIILPAVLGNPEVFISQNAGLLPWLVGQYKAGAEIASLCVGSFLLASTGLLNGRECATHWQFANLFRQMYPQALLRHDKIITDVDGIYTSGGAYSFTNLLVYLVEKYAGRDVAIMAAKTFMIDIERNSQSSFIIFTGQKAHNDETILQAQEFIEKNFQERLSVHTLSHNLGVGRRTFERRFKKATSNTVAEYIQRVKIEAAKKQLELSRKTVNEVMYEVGYTDTKAFRDVFKKITGMSPVAYRDKYNKRLVAAN